jgi:hypothetical protein
VDCVTGDELDARRNITIEGDATKRLAALPDPELIALWAELRTRLAYKTEGYAGVKAEYDAVAVEYRRRIEPVAS